VSEQLGSDVVGSADSRVALDPGTAPEVLAGIAQRRPELRVFVATNPSTYPGLVQWLAQLRDPAVDAALAGRAPVRAEVAAVPPPPPPPSVASAVPADPARAESGPGMGDGTNPTTTDVAPAAAGRTRRRGVVIAVVLVGVLILAGGGFAGYRMLTGGTRAAASTVTATIDVGPYPLHVAVDGSTHTAYVTNYDDGTVSVIDTRTNTVTDTITLGQNPGGVAVDESTHTAYVTNYYDGTVSVIDTRTNTVTDTITVGQGPMGVAVEPTTGSVFVLNSVDGTVSVLTAR